MAEESQTAEAEQVSIDPKRLQQLVKEHNHYERIMKAQEAVEILRRRREAAKTAARSADQAWKEAVDKLGELITDGANDPQMQLFPPEDEDGEIVSHGFDDEVDDDDDETPEPATAWTGTNDWRDEPVGKLKITEKQKDKLREIGVRNLGQFKELHDGRAPGFPEGLSDVKGWGDKAVAKIIDAAKKLIPGLGADEEDDEAQEEAPGLKLAETPEHDDEATQEPSDEAPSEDDWEDVQDDEDADSGLAEPVADDQNAEAENVSEEPEPQQSEATAEADEDDENTVHIELTKDIERLGLHKGDRLKGREFASGVMATLPSGKTMTFTKSEYVHADSVSA